MARRAVLQVRLPCPAAHHARLLPGSLSPLLQPPPPLLTELERYQELQREKEAADSRWEAAAAALAKQHARAQAEVAAGYEARLAQAQAAAAAAAAERSAAERQWAELRRQLEEDVDREVVGLKDRSAAPVPFSAVYFGTCACFVCVCVGGGVHIEGWQTALPG